MAEHTWPPGLPCVLVEGYQRAGEDGVLRSDFPGGHKIRPRFTSPPPETAMATIICTRAQVQTVMDFWEVTLKRTLAFNMRDHTKPDLTTVEYRFLARPSYAPVNSGNAWRVALELEQMSNFQGTFALSDGESLLSDGDDLLST